MKKIILQPFLWVLVIFMPTSSLLYAQSDSVTSVVAALRSMQAGKKFDTALFVKQANRLYRMVIEEKDLAELDALTSSFDKGENRDLNLYLKCSIFNSLARSNAYQAIDFGIKYYDLFKNNKSPNQEFFYTYLLAALRVPYRNSDRIGEGFYFFNDLLAKSKLNGDRVTTLVCYYVLSGFYRTVGLIDAAIYHLKKSQPLIDTTIDREYKYLDLVGRNFDSKQNWANNLGILGEYYYLKSDYEKAFFYSQQAILAEIRTKANIVGVSAYHLKNMALVYLGLNKLDSAAYILDKAEKYVLNTDYGRIAALMQVRSFWYLKKGKLDEAEAVLNDCRKMILERKLPVVTPAGVVAPDYYLALVKIEKKNLQEAVILLKKDIERIKAIRVDLLRDYKLLGSIYSQMGDHVKSEEYFSRYISLQDSLLADQSKFRLLSFEAEEQIAEKEKSINKLQSDNRTARVLWMLSLGVVLLLLILALLIYQRYRVKQKANSVLEKTLNKLKATQAQLVQSEKMASLGELTAGIAHEIQNPLNFVNNFSEVNTELLQEMKQELEKGNAEDAKAIANDVVSNQEKITHHGKRADAIVKGMLQHSRNSSGVKEATDINALTDEYLRLAYHGLRAKDKSFNATMKTDFDAAIGQIHVLPQDLGRVVLNLITNAFYAVNDRKKLNEPGYDPLVSVTTQKMENKVIIKVRDNGMGVPQKVQEKIFQPFFTTKPTGEGTGLGLSMSYDIITKSHAGELTFATQEGEYTEFSITLPIQHS